MVHHISSLHSLDEQLPHPLEQARQLPRLVHPLQHALDLLPLQLRPAVPDIVVPRRSAELEPRLALPVALVNVRVHELEPVVVARALDAQAQVRHPEVQLGHVEPRLRLQPLHVRPLRREPRVDVRLRVGDLAPELVAVLQLLVALGRERGDRRAHLARLGLLLGDRLLVGVGFELEDFDVLLLHALVLCAGKGLACFSFSKLRGVRRIRTLKFSYAHVELVPLL